MTNIKLFPQFDNGPAGADLPLRPAPFRLLRCKLASSLVRKNSAFALAVVLRAKSLSLVLVPRQRFFYDRDRRVCRSNVIHLDSLAFQLLVVLEKTPQNEQAVWRQFVGLDVTVEFRVV